jgi:hypothetical protein
MFCTKTNKYNILSLILTAAAALVIIAAICIAYFGPFYNIPLFKMVLGDNIVEEFKDLQHDALEADEDLTDFLHTLDVDLKDALDDDDLEDLYDACLDLVKNPSLGNMKKIFSLIGDKDTLGAYDLITSILWISFGIVAIFAILGGLLRKKGLIITGIVFSVPVFLLFSGVLFLIIFAAVLIAQIWVLSQIFD